MLAACMHKRRVFGLPLLFPFKQSIVVVTFVLVGEFDRFRMRTSVDRGNQADIRRAHQSFADIVKAMIDMASPVWLSDLRVVLVLLVVRLVEIQRLS